MVMHPTHLVDQFMPDAKSLLSWGAKWPQPRHVRFGCDETETGDEPRPDVFVRHQLHDPVFDPAGKEHNAWIADLQSLFP